MTPRALAVRALMRQEQDGYANLVLDAELKKCTPALSARDAAFAASIFYSTLERQNLLDYLLEQYSKKPVSKLDAPVRAILRAGLAQARFMEVPLPAAVNESVKLVKAFRKASAAGMVNAILRRAAAHPVTVSDFPDPLVCLTTYYSLSAPVAKLLYEQYGAEALEMAASFYKKEARPTAIRVNTLRTTDEELAAVLTAEGCAVRKGPWPHSLLVEFSGSPAASQAFRQGLFHVQGLPSQFAALCVDARPGQTVCDVCAAPGGKSLTLAQIMENTGSLRSGEVVPGRVGLMQKAFDRCGVTCAQAVCADGAQPLPGHYDRILCDVPCSGLGIIAKKPDIRYKDLAGLGELTALQRRILQNAAQSLAPGGRLVYSTCTVNRAENQDQILAFLDSCPDFAVIPPVIAFPGAQETDFGILFLPHKAGTDGFFVCILEKRK